MLSTVSFIGLFPAAILRRVQSGAATVGDGGGWRHADRPNHVAQGPPCAANVFLAWEGDRAMNKIDAINVALAE
jgi:hypothetical protein